MNTQDWSPLGWTGSSCSPRDSQKSSPTPHFKSINSSVLSLLHGPTLTSIHDYWKNHEFSSVQWLIMSESLQSHGRAACQASLSIISSQSSFRFMAIESVMPSSHLILGRPLLLLPPIPLSIKVFFNESTLHMRWPKYWSFSFSIIPSKGIPGLISFRMDWLTIKKSGGRASLCFPFKASEVLSKCTQDKRDKLNGPITIKEIKFAV